MKRAAIVALCFGLLTSRVARAQSASGEDLLIRAQAAADDVDYEQARTLVTRAIAEGGLSAGNLSRALRFAGEVAAALGDDKAARRHFVQWLLLDPNAALAPGVSPKIASAFDAARNEFEKIGGFSLSAKVARHDGTARVTVEGHDPLEMVASIRVHRAGADDVTARGHSVDVPVRDTESVQLTVTALDAHDNVLWTGDARVASSVVEVDRGFPGWARWPTWTAVAVASAAAGGYFAWQEGRDEDELLALHRESSLHTYDEARAIEERGQRDALFANVGFGVAGAAAVAAVLTYVLEPGGVEVRPVAGSGSTGLSAAMRF